MFDMKESRTALNIDKAICRTQGAFFEYVCTLGYDLKYFAEYFMHSSFAKGFDSKGSRCVFEDPETCFEIMFWKKEKDLDSLKKYASDPAIGDWIGYTYRQFTVVSDLPSREVWERVPFDKLLLNYAAHHTLDEYYSIEMLCSFFDVPVNDFYKDYFRYLEG